MGFFNGVPVSIKGTGMYVPEKVLTNQDLTAMVDTSDEWIRDRTGIRRRHIAAEGELTSSIAEKASREALRNSGISPEDLDMVIVATNSPDTLFPGVAPKLQGMLEAKKAGAFDVQSGCTSGVYSMAIAAGGIASGVWKNVLVVGAEVLSRIIDWTDRNTCVLFGDGAGAMVLGPAADGEGHFISANMRSDGTKHDQITLLGGLVEYPASGETLEKKKCVLVQCRQRDSESRPVYSGNTPHNKDAPCHNGTGIACRNAAARFPASHHLHRQPET
jgi:3-oxoacyl-[acyl-carrier-protein] synthase-3